MIRSSQVRCARSGVLDLDTRELEISRITLPDGAELAWELSENDPILGRRLRIELPEGSPSVTIEYETSPQASALQWLKPANTAGRKYPYLFSQCQPHHARSMLPLQDSAGVRFRYTATVEVPAPLVVVMSAAPGGRWKFRQMVVTSCRS